MSVCLGLYFVCVRVYLVRVVVCLVGLGGCVRVGAWVRMYNAGACK